MAASGAIPVQGMVLAVSTASGGTYTTVGEVTRVKPWGLDTNFTTATRINSDNKVVENRPTTKIVGDCTFTIQWLPADTTHQRLTDNWVAQTPEWYKVTSPDGASTPYGPVECYVKKFEPGDMTPEGLMTASVELRPKDGFTPPT